MSPKTCTVSLTDVRGSRHTVEVMAESLFEAAVYGLKILRENGWVPDKPGPATRLDIQVKEPAVSHEVTVLQIHRWLEGRVHQSQRDGPEAKAQGHARLAPYPFTPITTLCLARARRGL